MFKELKTLISKLKSKINKRHSFVSYLSKTLKDLLKSIKLGILPPKEKEEKYWAVFLGRSFRVTSSTAIAVGTLMTMPILLFAIFAALLLRQAIKNSFNQPIQKKELKQSFTRDLERLNKVSKNITPIVNEVGERVIRANKTNENENLLPTKDIHTQKHTQKPALQNVKFNKDLQCRKVDNQKPTKDSMHSIISLINTASMLYCGKAIFDKLANQLIQKNQHER